MILASLLFLAASPQSDSWIETYGSVAGRWQVRVETGPLGSNRFLNPEIQYLDVHVRLGNQTDRFRMAHRLAAATDRKAVGIWWYRREPIVWVLSMRDNNNWESNVLALFHRRKGRWVEMKLPVKQDLYLSQRGGFYVGDQGLRFWDFLVDRGHDGPSRYRVRLFVPSENSLRCTSDRTTKGFYRQEYWPPPDKVAAKDDPLREFGLRWRFWSPRISSKSY